MRKARMAILSGLVGWVLASSAAQADEATNLMGHVPSIDELVQALTPVRPQLTRGLRAVSAAAVEPSRPAVDLAINFEFDSARLTPRAQAILDNLGSAINSDLAAYQFTFEGHTDAVGSAGYNQGLSERRAQAVRDYLVERFRVDGTRVSAIGKGEDELLVPDEPKAASNRRVRVVNSG